MVTDINLNLNVKDLFDTPSVQKDQYSDMIDSLRFYQWYIVLEILSIVQMYRLRKGHQKQVSQDPLSISIGNEISTQYFPLYITYHIMGSQFIQTQWKMSL